MAEWRMRTTGDRFIDRPGTHTAPRPTRGSVRRRLEVDDPPQGELESTTVENKALAYAQEW
ncbi:hypothetical protein GCM10011578_008290 [Streptomyces fuscichromogenes]|uniref:Uncharacterized protein n=1 Tax=Streptomyces fuscichromogenes TaxID=1324013 RepID=A0A917UHF5_9ACTN|nr:hypothetical protein GCM10011578_008290 [Streptomyces fuscichromogenes]